MAAPVKKMVGASDDSSSDDEELRRCQEAVWETRRERSKDEDNSVKESRRVVVDDHDHDGNELQVTQGFRTHVAKKLGRFLDAYITERQAETSSCVKLAKCGGDDDDDEGFRLFSTSVPGKTAEDPPAPVKRRPVSSSSDSDSEMETRLREAAVSIKDLLPSSLQPSELSPTLTGPPCSEKIRNKEKKTEGEESNLVKKKKKRKRDREKAAQVDSAGSPPNSQSGDERESLEQEHTPQVNIKRKKKKKRKENAEEEALN